MGVVYLAFDKLISRQVALKELFLPLSLSEKEREHRIKRFLREAQAAGNLSHPNIVTVYDVAEENGKYYIAMEYLEGKTLRELLELGPFPLEKAFKIMEQLCDALNYAHQKGVIHRDLKPDNLFLLPDGRLKVTDFGIARILSDPTMTKTGAVIGSPGYMSPEQVRGEKISRSSDIFSVGVILYEILTGKNPFEAESVTTMIYKILNEEPPLVNFLKPEVPVKVGEVIKKAMSKNPQDRFSSTDELKKELLSALKRTLSLEAQAIQPKELEPEMAIPLLIQNKKSSRKNWLLLPFIILLFFIGIFYPSLRLFKLLKGPVLPLRQKLREELEVS